MKIYFDTNIVIDILKLRKPHFEKSNAAFLLAVNGQIDGIIGVSSITDIFYICRNDFEDTGKAVKIIFDILKIIKPIDILVLDIYKAAELEFLDYEDAVISAAAQREKANFILTRNKKDFLKSVVPAITPDELLQMLADKMK